MCVRAVCVRTVCVQAVCVQAVCVQAGQGGLDLVKDSADMLTEARDKMKEVGAIPFMPIASIVGGTPGIA